MRLKVYLVGKATPKREVIESSLGRKIANGDMSHVINKYTALSDYRDLDKVELANASGSTIFSRRFNELPYEPLAQCGEPVMVELKEDKPQPFQAAVAHSDVTELFTALTLRTELGLKKYGKMVHPGNGRNALIDMYDEVLDGIIYQAMYDAEQASKVVPVERVTPPAFEINPNVIQMKPGKGSAQPYYNEGWVNSMLVQEGIAHYLPQAAPSAAQITAAKLDYSPSAGVVQNHPVDYYQVTPSIAQVLADISNQTISPRMAILVQLAYDVRRDMNQQKENENAKKA